MSLPGRRSVTLGRELDGGVAELTGEGAQQRLRHPEPVKGSPELPVWNKVPSLPGVHPTAYYDVPLLKEPVWIWSVPAYFYLGGVAGGSAVLGAFLHGQKPFRRLASRCRWLAFAGTTLGSGLLTWDLGRKFRFIKMLRVFRPTSPMSIGSWSLAGTGMLATLMIIQGDRPSGRFISYALAGGGIAVAGYTGVLVGNTANPFWAESRLSLPPLFIASAMASTAAILEVLPLDDREERVVNRFGIVGKIAEAAGMIAVEREVSRNPEAARSLHESRAGVLWKSARTLLAASIVLSLVPFKASWKRKVAGTLSTVGAVCLRFALLEVGRQAARQPEAVTAGQRRQLEV